MTDSSNRAVIRKDKGRNPVDRLVEMLDHIEKRVEILREHAAAMEQEKDVLLSMIKTVQSNDEIQTLTEDEREEILLTAERLLGRTLSVDVSVSTIRNALQQEALKKVNESIDGLLTKVNSDAGGAKQTCQLYLNACLPEFCGPIDQSFQSAVIECTADDQKKTRKRLESLLITIQNTEKNSKQK